jgi:hypothetical protein
MSTASLAIKTRRTASYQRNRKKHRVHHTAVQSPANGFTGHLCRFIEAIHPKQCHSAIGVASSAATL